ncbi:MAG: right-handed parallel beta-helix repeat-containing protein [Nanoarchaeota archaeon]
MVTAEYVDYNCSADSFQLDLNNTGSPAECVINRSGGNMMGISGSCSDGTCAATWTVPRVPQECVNRSVRLDEFSFWKSGDIVPLSTYHVTDMADPLPLSECYLPLNDDQISHNLSFCPGTYWLEDGIDIVTNDTRIDCQGAELQGGGSNSGITLSTKEGVTIRGCDISLYDHGISIAGGSSTLLTANYLRQNQVYGIYALGGTSDLNVTNNDFVGNRYAFRVDTGGSGIKVKGNRFARGICAAISLVNSVESVKILNNTIWDNDPTSCGMGSSGGFGLWQTNNSVIRNNTIINASYGLDLFRSSNNSFSFNNLSLIPFGGVRLNDHSTNNTLANNTIRINEADPNRYAGISLNERSSQNIIRNNLVEGSRYGIKIDLGSVNNILRNNRVADIDEWSYYLDFDSCNNSADTSNTGGDSGKPFLFIHDRNSYSLSDSDDYSEIQLCNVSQGTLTNIIISNPGTTSDGLLLINSTDITLQNIRSENNYAGIWIDHGKNNRIQNSELRSNEKYGIHLAQQSPLNILQSNIICQNGYLDLFCNAQALSTSGSNNFLDTINNGFGACDAVLYNPCGPCVIDSFSISEPSCTDGTCDEGETVQVSALYTACEADKFQLELKDSGLGECIINRSGGNMGGLNGTCSGGVCTGTWTVPHIAQECLAKHIMPQESCLYPPNQPFNGTPEACTSTIAGSFDFTSCYRPIDNDQIGRSVDFCPDFYSLPQGLNIISNATSIDCQGATLQGVGFLQSLIDIRYKKNITVSNCRLKTYEYGVFVHMSSNVEVRDSHFDQTPSTGSSRCDVRVQSNGPAGNSGNISIHDNTFINSQFGILLAYLNDTNRVFNNHFYDIKSVAIMVYGPKGTYSDGQLDVYDNVVDGVGLISSGAGVNIENGDNARVYSNEISRGGPGNGNYGIYLEDSENIEVNNNTVSSVKTGIRLKNADFINVHDNAIQGLVMSASSYGIYLYDGSSNNLLNNNIVCAGVVADLKCQDAQTSASGANNFFSVVDDPQSLCSAVTYYPCGTCVLSAANIESTSCGRGDCETGDFLDLSAHYLGNCPGTTKLQINTSSSDGSCKILHSGTAMQGVDGSCTGGYCVTFWQVPTIAQECFGKQVFAEGAELWSGEIGNSVLLDTTPGIGNVTFRAMQAPTIGAAWDTPDPVQVGEQEVFSMIWSGDGPTRMIVCDQPGLVGQACQSNLWCDTPYDFNPQQSCAVMMERRHFGTQPYTTYACNAAGCAESLPGFLHVEDGNCCDNPYLGCYDESMSPVSCYYNASPPYGPVHFSCCSLPYYDEWQNVFVYH